jgi:hypothetical protein
MPPKSSPGKIRKQKLKTGRPLMSRIVSRNFPTSNICVSIYASFILIQATFWNSYKKREMDIFAVFLLQKICRIALHSD